MGEVSHESCVLSLNLRFAVVAAGAFAGSLKCTQVCAHTCLLSRVYVVHPCVSVCVCCHVCLICMLYALIV